MLVSFPTLAGLWPRRRAEAIVVPPRLETPEPVVAYCEFERPLMGYAIVRTPGEMVLLLLDERRQLVRERNAKRACPLRLGAWADAIGKVDAELARLEGLCGRVGAAGG